MSHAKHCLVLGGRGFIGSHLVDALLAAGHRVRCFDRPNVKRLDEPSSVGVNPLGNFELFEGDLGNDADIAQALTGCDVCFHLISTTLPQSSNADPVFDIESNLIGTLRLLKRAVQAKVGKIVFVSSGGTVYGIPQHTPINERHPTNPLCSYGIAKLAIEKYLHLFRELHGLNYTILRLANPFGERQRTHASQGAVAVFVGKALRGETIDIWGDGTVIRDYIHIADVASALLAAMDHDEANDVFNIGSGQGLSLNDILDAIESVTGHPTQRNYLPGRTFDVPVNYLDISHARRHLGWTPTVSFAEGLRRFVAWVKQNES